MITKNWTPISWLLKSLLRATRGRDPGGLKRLMINEEENYDLFFCRISEPSADPEDLQLLSPEEREKRRSFEAKSRPFTWSVFSLSVTR